jgi:threonine dehydrogenase-like Zn-dependent dehydrogenase
MKAAIIQRPNELVVREVHEPAVGDYEALCEILYGATCTGTDSHLIHGRFPWGNVVYPTILGHESVGRVIALGPKVRNYRVGDVVTRVGTPASPRGEYASNWGGFAEYGIARDHWAMQADDVPTGAWVRSRWNQILPQGFDPAVATMLTTWRETLSYLTRMGLKAGATLLVVGSGGVGLSFAAHGALLGAGRVAVLGNVGRAETAHAIGVTDFFDYKADDVNDAMRQALPAGFDFIIDSVGRRSTLNEVLPLIRPGGTAGIYGIDEFREQQINPGRARGGFTYYNGGYDESETHQRVVEMVLQGRLDARHWLNLDTPYPLDDIAEAFAALDRRELVKALIRVKPLTR